MTLIIQSTVVLFALRMTQAMDSTTIEARGHHFHKIPYGVLLLHTAYGTVATLVIIKIILAISFVGMVTTLLHMFASIKYLLRINQAKTPEPDRVYMPQTYHSHESFHGYDSAGADDHGPYPYYHRRWDIAGARSLGNIEVTNEPKYETQKSHDIRKRNMEKLLNEDRDSAVIKRITRSIESNNNCKRNEVCKLHANALQNPFSAFQLYFIKRDGLAKYWDHNERSGADCDKSFPCNKPSTSTNQVTSKTKIQDAPKIATASGRQYTDYGSYSTEYETEYSVSPDASDYDPQQSY